MPEFIPLKFLPLAYHYSHFLATTLDFTSFFTTAFFSATHFLTAGLFWITFHFLSFLELHAIKLADYMLAVICLILYTVGSSVKIFNCIMSFLNKINPLTQLNSLVGDFHLAGQHLTLYWMTIDLAELCT